MIAVERGIVIARSAKDVFAFVGDQTNAPRWQRGLTDVRRTTDGPIGVGTRHSFSRTLAGRRMEGSNEYTRYEPDSLVAFRATSGGWPLEASYRIEPIDATQTRLTARIELRPAGAFRLLEPLIAAALGRDVRANLLTLKEVLEAPT